MIFDLYLQGLVEQNNGKLLLSLSEDQLNSVCDHEYRGTNAIKDLVTMLVTSRSDPKTGIVSPDKASEFIDAFRREEAKMYEYRTNSREDPQVQQNFYLSQVVSIMTSALVRSTREERGLLMHVRPEALGHKTKFRRIETKNYDLCGINGVTIEIANPETDNFFGKIDWTDYIENSGGSDPWIAHPVPSVARIKTRNPLYIRPALINGLTNGYNFTLLKDFDHQMEKYISESIEQFKSQLQE